MQNKFLLRLTTMALMCGLLFLSVPSAQAQKAGGREVIFRWTDKTPKLQFVGSWYFKHESAYTTKYQGNRDAKGKAICKPGLSGTYEIFASFRATENRGRAAKYLVDGKLVRTENQRSSHSGGSHSVKFPEVRLGTFELNPDSAVVMNADDGQSYSFTQFRFKPAKAGSQGQLGSIDDVLAAPEGGEIALTSSSQGDKTYTAAADCEVSIKSLLSTYGPARLFVSLNGEKIITWDRQNDTDPGKLIVNGEEIAGSNTEVKPGDFSPSPQETRLELKAGDKLDLHLSGDFGAAESYLKLVAPGAQSEEAPAPKNDNSGEAVAGSGGGFLWKPVAETRGHVCAIILPSKYRQDQFNHKIWVNGAADQLKEWRGGYANGNRIHIFLKKPGKEYGGKVTVELGLKSGGRVKWEIPNGASRFER